MYPRVFVILLVMFLFSPSSPAITAQAEAMTCPALVEQALTELSNNCLNIKNGTACYGHKQIQVTIPGSNEMFVFQESGDRIPISGLQSITTSPADMTIGDWGIVILNINDVHTSLSAYMLLFGDATVENKDTESQLPIQNINIRTAFGTGTCNEAPSMLVMQSQTDVVVNMIVNDSIIRVAGLVVFQQQSANALIAMVQSGQLAIAGGPTVEAGQTIVGVMDNNRNILFWSAPRPVNSEEMQVAELNANVFSRIGVITTLAETPLPVPTSIPIPDATPTAIPTSYPTCGNNIIHVVEPGENLFRIALRYGTTVEAIMAANGVSNRDQIAAGQQLIIPCGVDSEASGNNEQVIDCSRLGTNLPANLPPALQDQLNRLCQKP